MSSYVYFSVSNKNWPRRKEWVNFMLLGVLHDFLTPVDLDKH